MSDAFRKVSREEYAAAIRSAPCSDRFREEYARMQGEPYEGWHGPSFAVHDGDLEVDGDWRAPGLHTLIVGGLSATGVVDLANREDEGFDEGGEFVCLGDLSCRAFSGHYGKVSYVDGILEARDVLNNDFNYSTLRILGDMRTRLYVAPGNPAEVGGAAAVGFRVGSWKRLASTSDSGIRLPPEDAVGLRHALAQGFDPADPDFGRNLIRAIRDAQVVFSS